jgi:hypothetical protein
MKSENFYPDKKDVFLLCIHKKKLLSNYFEKTARAATA